MSAPRILVIEDTESMAALYLNYLHGAGFEADHASEGRAGMAMMNKKPYHAVVLDLHLPDMNGLEILEQLRQHYEDIPVLIITAHGSISIAVESMKMGAFDFIVKPFAAARLTTTVHKALEHRKMERELAELRREVFQENFQQDFVGSSPGMQAIFRQLEAVAPSKANIFITGEAGTGKELLARAIHRSSPRAPELFVVLDCAHIPAERMEGELFGQSAHEGALQLAHNGTLYLDEINAMPLPLQGKLLKFLQTGNFTPLGSTHTQQADVRIISSSHRDVRREVEDGHLNEDLFYHIYVVPFEVPALRERENDVVLLATHFLKQNAQQQRKNFTGFAPDVLSLFLQYEWHGNVRQLEDLIQHTVATHEGPLVTMEMLPEKMTNSSRSLRAPQRFMPFLVKPLWQVERDAILKALEASHNDVPRAAAILEVSPSTIYRKLQGWKIGTEALARSGAVV